MRPDTNVNDLAEQLDHMEIRRHVESSSNSAGRPTKRWARVLFRTVVTIDAALVLLQAALAGAFLNGHYDALDMHALNAKVIIITTFVMVICAVLQWRPGGGPGWPAIVCVVIAAAAEVQIIMGYKRVLAVHVPLGVTVIASIALMLAWVWRPARGQTGTAA